MTINTENASFVQEAKRNGTAILAHFKDVPGWHQVAWTKPRGTSHCEHWCIEGRWTPLDPDAFMPMPAEPGVTDDVNPEERGAEYWHSVAIWMGDVLAASAEEALGSKSVGKGEKKRQRLISKCAADALQNGHLYAGKVSEDRVVSRLREAENML